MILNKIALVLSMISLAIALNAFAENSQDRCEFSKDDPKGNLFLVKEFDEYTRRGGHGVFLSTYRMTPLTRKDPKTGMPIGNFKDNDAQSSEIFKIAIPYKSLDQLAYEPEALAQLRDFAKGPFGIGETMNEIPCEFDSIRFCGMAEPFTQHAEEEDEKKYSKDELKKQFRRFTSLRIEHCLSNEKIPDSDREVIDNACEKPPPETPPTDRGLASFRGQILACAKALNAYMAKSKDYPLNERKKYVPAAHGK
jgi:hypothetical protein